MLANISERRMHQVRWVLTIGWGLLIVSLLYDPLSPWFTLPTNSISPLKINPEICVQVQGKCLEQKNYALGAPIFWGIVIPAAIFNLLVFGHETWRRICPLSFVSQIPRALGRQRHQRRVDAKTGKERFELVKVNQKSWLANNYLYIQFGLFYIGLCSRILFINSDRTALFSFLIITITAAIAVGYLYGGKSWCQYFCPMAPVQKIYAEPRGLFNSKAHDGERQAITQSMCRTVNKEGKELSACVACNSPCIDIDAERAYWENITKPEQQWLYYAYVGLVVGYFVYYYLYAGNWEYYFSGAWSHQNNQLATLLSPGFYLFSHAIPIPKIIAVPLTLGAFTFGGYFLGRKLEKRYKAYLLRQHQSASIEIVRYQMFTLCTFFIFNFFFIFAGRNFIRLLPPLLQYLFPVLIAVCSTIWLCRTWQRNPDLYQRESLASRLRKQLSKLNLDTSRFLEGRSLDELSADEVYVLAKVLPGFHKEKRLQVYKGVLQEALKEGYVDYSSSLEVLQQMRQELDITKEEHDLILTELEVEYPTILDPTKQHNREDLLRQESYREAFLDVFIEVAKNHPNQTVVAELVEVMTGEKPIESLDAVLNKLSKDESLPLQQIREEYAITAAEEEEILKTTEPRQLWTTIAYTLDTLNRLEAIAIKRQLIKEATPITVKQELSVEQVAHCQEIFQKFDKDGNNRLSRGELCSVLRVLGCPFSPQRVQEIMDAISEHSNSDSVSFEEFAVLLQSDLGSTNEDQILQWFHLFDADGSGYISLEELHLYIKDIVPNITKAEIENMLKLADTSGDQQISYEEFRDLLQQMTQ
ncbi:EF-hand domain-containing protein [Anabaena minutissima FACHB-250]|nr:EF-hand domain-containing protein [Anabaena minutissima FACHB-250]